MGKGCEGATQRVYAARCGTNIRALDHVYAARCRQVDAMQELATLSTRRGSPTAPGSTAPCTSSEISRRSARAASAAASVTWCAQQRDACLGPRGGAGCGGGQAWLRPAGVAGRAAARDAAVAAPSLPLSLPPSLPCARALRRLPCAGHRRGQSARALSARGQGAAGVSVA